METGLLGDNTVAEIAQFIKELDTVAKFNHNSRDGLSYQRLQRLKSYVTSTELHRILHLVNSHVPTLREKTAMRYKRLLDKNKCEEFARNRLEFLKNIISTECSGTQIDESVAEMLRQVQEMPKEWTVIHLTSFNFNASEVNSNDPTQCHMNPLNITVFNCGQNTIQPFLITVNEPRDAVSGTKVNLVEAIVSILKENKETLISTSGQKLFPNIEKKLAYLQRRQNIESNLKLLIKDMENLWLKHWRCLFIGKFVDETLERGLREEIDHYFNSQMKEVELCCKMKEILCYVIKGAQYLKLSDIRNAVDYCCGSTIDKDTVKRVTRFIKDLGDKYAAKDPKKLRHPVILVIDEILDCFPWETLDVLRDNPVTRMPSLHFVYFLYKAYEDEIQGGHKIVTKYDRCSYVVNPDGDLMNMQRRIMQFFNYWVPHWTGTSECRPDDDEFFQLITNADIFSYNGHGNGSHIMSLEKLQRVLINAVVLLFGCGSSKITRLGPQVEPYGSYHMYLIARCPCVVGMLWEVTDLDTDMLTTEFISRWVPSDAPVHWKHVQNKEQWKWGEKNVRFVESSDAIKTNHDPDLHDPELLRALNQAKKTAQYYITKAACVVRGLPVKIKSISSPTL